MRQRRVDRAHGVHQVDLELVPERVVVPVHVERADVRDHDVDAAQLRSARLDPADQRFPVGDVERPARRLHALALERLDRRLDPVRAARADRDVAAFGRERLGDRPPDALAAAGDDRFFAPQPEIHSAPPPSRCFAQPRYVFSTGPPSLDLRIEPHAEGGCVGRASVITACVPRSRSGGGGAPDFTWHQTPVSRCHRHSILWAREGGGVPSPGVPAGAVLR